MFPVCPLCCFIVISMDPVSEINDDDDDDDDDNQISFLPARQNRSTEASGQLNSHHQVLAVRGQKVEDDRIQSVSRSYEQFK